MSGSTSAPLTKEKPSLGARPHSPHMEAKHYTDPQAFTAATSGGDRGRTANTALDEDSPAGNATTHSSGAVPSSAQHFASDSGRTLRQTDETNFKNLVYPLPHFIPVKSFEYIFFVCTSVLLNLAGYLYFYRWGVALKPLLLAEYYYNEVGDMVFQDSATAALVRARLGAAAVAPDIPAGGDVVSSNIVNLTSVSTRSFPHRPPKPRMPTLDPPLFPFSWLGSVGVDVGDEQWSTFFTSLPLVLGMLLFFVWLGTLVRRYATVQTLSHVVREPATPSATPNSSSVPLPEWQNAVSSPWRDTPVEHSVSPFNSSNDIAPSTRRHSSPSFQSSPYAKLNLRAPDPFRSGPMAKRGCRGKSVGEDDDVVNSLEVDEGSVSLLPSLFTKSTRKCNRKAVLAALVPSQPPQAARPRPIFLYHTVVGLLVVSYVSGPRFLFGLSLMLLNYFVISKLDIHRVPFFFCMLCMWVFMVATLFLNHYYKGYHYESIFGSSLWFVSSIQLDNYAHLIKWTVHYNMAVLRMIAFNNDAWEARTGTHSKRSASSSNEQEETYAEKRRREVYEKHQKLCVDCALLREAMPALSGVMRREEQQEGAIASGALSQSTEDKEKTASSSAESSTAAPPTKGCSLGSSRPQPYPAHHTREFLSCGKCRTECPRPVEQYNLLGYLGFLLYPPLFFSGPMLSYNAYVSMVTKPSQTYNRKKKVEYILRVAGNLCFMVAFMHYFFVPTLLFATVSCEEAIHFGFLPVNSNSSNTTADPRLNPQVSVLDFFSLEEKCYLFYAALAFLWCKFNVVWKFFRCFAILDGIEPPEDMPHCFSNTVSITDFWQCWHASFNLWIVRYMYIPLGGSRRKLFTLVPIFLFIAIWHDIELRLLQWALFMCVCFVPEIAIVTFFTKSKIRCIASWRSRPVVWRRIKEVGATIGEWALILANLIGFSTGGSTTLSTVSSAFGTDGISTWFLALFLLFYIGTGKLSVRYREVQAHQLQCTKIRLGMANQ